jgi:single-strand DNA-binding protein
MSKDVNKCMFTGRLGADPEMRYTQAGKAVTSFRIASNHSFTTSDGTRNDIAEWVSCVAWDKLGELANTYLHKGARVYVEGRMQTRKWQDKDGNDRYTTEIILTDMVFLDAPKRDTEDEDAQPVREAPQPRQQAPQRTQSSNAGNSYRANAAARNGARNAPQAIDDDESLPF